MRRIKWKLAVLTMIMILAGEYSAFGEGLGGWLNIISSSSKATEDGEKTSSSDSLNQNYYLNLERPVTPMFSYRINLRSSLIDSRAADAQGEVTDAYQRLLEPGFDVTLQNPMYNLNAGYRRQEKWSTAHLSSEGRETLESYYSRLNLTPTLFPSLIVNLDRQNNFDYLSDRKKDRSNDQYSLGSTYELPSSDVKFRFDINYLHNTGRDRISTIEKTINDNFSGNYNAGYSDAFWDNRANYSILYQGNYSRNKSTQFAVQTGTVLNRRTSLGGWHKHDALTEDIGVLDPNGLLVDGDTETSAGVELGRENITNKLHNIGISVSSQRPVDRLFIYVKSLNNVTGDAALRSAANWKVFKSDFNQAGTWSPIAVKGVTLTTFDTLSNLFIYKIEFLTPEDASFFKAVNITTSDINNVSVTEIEAHGTDEIGTEELVDVFNTFNQELNMVVTAKLLSKLSLSLNYSIDRLDENPVSVMNSLGGVFKNAVSDSISGERSDFKSSITRNYGFGTTWLTHRYLTTTLRFQRNENFDNTEETDTDSSTYNVSFNSVILPTLDTNLSFTRSERESFSEKDSANNSYLLSIGSKLYENLNMITDLGYTQAESFTADTNSSTYTINGTVDARITRKITGTLNYGLNRTSSTGSSSSSKNALMLVNYQPGRFVNLSANVNVLDSSGDKTISEGLLADWLLLPSVRLNLNYQHVNSGAAQSTSDSVSGYAIWYIAKFADVRFSYSYTLEKEETRTNSYNFNTNLNCRF
ncbi:MAG: hypothetical protein HZA14_00280 [Nitrospirae bacterium]|nr:hypothetical protein [Nitrospirota bacterium]